MDNQQAIEILIQVAHLAQKNGLLQLQEAVAVAQAIEVLKQKENELQSE